MDDLTTQIENAVIKALNRGAADNKYIDVGRIPFICDDIREIKNILKENSSVTQWTVKMIWLAIGGLSVLTVVVLPFIFSVVQSGKI